MLVPTAESLADLGDRPALHAAGRDPPFLVPLGPRSPPRVSPPQEHRGAQVTPRALAADDHHLSRLLPELPRRVLLDPDRGELALVHRRGVRVFGSLGVIGNEDDEPELLAHLLEPHVVLSARVAEDPPTAVEEQVDTPRSIRPLFLGRGPLGESDRVPDVVLAAARDGERFALVAVHVRLAPVLSRFLRIHLVEVRGSHRGSFGRVVDGPRLLPGAHGAVGLLIERPAERQHELRLWESPALILL